MYYIDLSFLKSELPVETRALVHSESACNNCFQSLIINKLNRNHSNISGCFATGIEYEIAVPIDNRNIIEASCEGLLGCHFCEISQELKEEIIPGDVIIVETEDSFEVAHVKLMGEFVKIKRQYMSLYGEYLPKAIRKAKPDDFERVTKNRSDEQKAVDIFKDSAKKFNLDMKLVSIHFQFDRKRLFFFYTADGRVDFREMAKHLASIFKTRIELRQIGVRDEAKKIGGMGTCGREYCCSAFLNNFKKITTQLANEQNLLSSMGKLSGPCGKLKCCLSFEVELTSNQS